MRTARLLLFFVFSLWLFTFFISPKPVFAQTTTTNQNSFPTNSYATPNTDPDVPRNQSTLAQTVTIEVISAITCQLSGINPINPAQPCLGINPKTHKIGYAPGSNSPDSQPKVGGIVGMATQMIAFTYQPIVSSEVYTQYLSDNFGIVKKAHAQSAGYGFEGLKPIFYIWISVRNIAYGLLIIAFAFIGVGIMLRVKIDPRTVMSIQNQIPKAIMAIILITFSYAISALLIDLMWVTTYAGVNLIINSSPQAQNLQVGSNGETLNSKASRQLLEIPLVYVNNIFHTGRQNLVVTGQTTGTSGVFHLVNNVSDNISVLLQNVVENVLGVDKGDSCVSRGKGTKIFGTAVKLPTLPSVHVSACFADALGFITGVIAQLIILVILLVALFKIWFQLIKAFVYTLFYVIISPVYIIFGLLPSKPLGFEKWLRSLFVNLAIFPVTAFVIVAARVMMDAYDTSKTSFIPPLIGHNVGANFGSLLALGALIITPHLQKILQEKMGVKGVGSPGLIGAGLAAGAAVIGAPAGRAMKHLNRYDPRTNEAGFLARKKKELGTSALNQLGKMGSARAVKAVERRERIDETGQARGTGKPDDKFEERQKMKPRKLRELKKAEWAKDPENPKNPDSPKYKQSRWRRGKHSPTPSAAAPASAAPTKPIETPSSTSTSSSSGTTSSTGGAGKTDVTVSSVESMAATNPELGAHLNTHSEDKEKARTLFAASPKSEGWRHKKESDLTPGEKDEMVALLKEIHQELKDDRKK